MTDTDQRLVWLFEPAARTAHAFRPGALSAAICGRRNEGGLGTAPHGMHRCGQCARRFPRAQPEQEG